MDRWETIEAKVWDYVHGDEVHQDKVLQTLHRIDDVRREKNAVILAHYYQIPPIQMIADYTGDSLALALKAKDTKDKDLIVCSTVHFMAEMVKLLSPEKKVVIPVPDASCSIAEGMNASTLQRIRELYPTAALVGYINSTAETKAHLDVVCTSANAQAVATRVSGDPVILLPDHYFAQNIIAALPDDGRVYLSYIGIHNGTIQLYNPRTKEIMDHDLGSASPPLLNEGVCIVHKNFTPEMVVEYRKREKPDVVLAHPEVTPEVVAMADIVGGTGKMIRYVTEHPNLRSALYLTECDLAKPLIDAAPRLKLITPCLLCPYMKKNKLDGVLFSLEQECFEVTVPVSYQEPARKSIERMFELMR
ncbi:quinolinate synthase NadA [Candidatus Woesearchaeota archaeon]|nr:quinolinate synthase NadA [Candidatus Woesearchaeota archaeon]